MCNQVLRQGWAKHQTLCSKFNCMLGCRPVDTGAQMICYWRTSPVQSNGQKVIHLFNLIRPVDRPNEALTHIIYFDTRQWCFALDSEWSQIWGGKGVTAENEGMKTRSKWLTWGKSDVEGCCARPASTKRTSLSECAWAGVHMLALAITWLTC